MGAEWKHSGKPKTKSASLVLSDAVQEVSWVSPTCLSRLILLSTLRDNNTGQYRHPTLARKFPSDAVSRALARIHKEACEELLRYPIAELVYELELYADQTRAAAPELPVNMEEHARISDR